jgi:hypothetical protein
LTDVNGNLSLRAYAIGNWSRFVRPGWHEVAVRGGGALLVTAFQGSDARQAAIIVVNKQRTPIVARIRVGGGMTGALTPWLTSSTAMLTQRPPAMVVDGIVTYECPAASIVTLSTGT